ncbi:Uncharacterised protein [Streptococcus pneumoniae]|nr:Uncharacterised protein [Streptococcus pneumoniae]
MNPLIVGSCCISLMLITIKLNPAINNRGMILNISAVKAIGIPFKIRNTSIKLLSFAACLLGVVDFLSSNCRKKVERNNKAYAAIEKAYMYCKLITTKRIPPSEVPAIRAIVPTFICTPFICNNSCSRTMSGITDCNAGK